MSDKNLSMDKSLYKSPVSNAGMLGNAWKKCFRSFADNFSPLLYL